MRTSAPTSEPELTILKISIYFLQVQPTSLTVFIAKYLMFSSTREVVYVVEAVETVRVINMSSAVLINKSYCAARKRNEKKKIKNTKIKN